MKIITKILGGYQKVFSFFEEYEKYFYDELTEEHMLLLKSLEIVENESYVFLCDSGRGRPPHSRLKLFRAFFAKSILRISTNKDLISRLKSDRNLKRICGYSNEESIPHKSSFSRAFSEFSDLKITEAHHDEMIKKHIFEELIANLSRDSTAIKCREKPVNKKRDIIPKTKRKRGRPKKNETVEPKEPSNIEKQLIQSPEEALSELNMDAAWAVKKNSQGKSNAWKGYKLHLDVTDLGIPVTVILTGANVHDSQLAIPMEKITEKKCTHLYSLMDSAYDAKHIHEYIKSKGRIPVIDENKRRKEKIGFNPVKKERYKARSTVERCNSHLKDWLFGQAIYVKGHKKVMTHLMFGVLALTAMKILQYGY